MIKEYIWGTEDWIYQDSKLLVKVIESHDFLSIQVHPDDDYAQKIENLPNGKNEMWYILSAEKDAYLYCGFNQDTDRETVKNAALDGSITQLLNKIYVQPGQLIKIPAGTVHAIGAGIKLIEIQQNSTTTYRLYDYKRLGTDGKPRELHLEKALDVLNYNKYDENIEFKIFKDF